jgi:Pectate lyase superfamily protein
VALQKADIVPVASPSYFAGYVEVDANSNPDGQANVTLVNGPNHNIAIPESYAILAGGPTAAFSIGGFEGTIVPGQALTFQNLTNEPCTILNLDVDSTPPILTPSGSNFLVAPGASMQLAFTYDTSALGGAGAWRFQNPGAPQIAEKNLRDFGAEGDGVTDDTAAFARAFAYLSAAGGGLLRIPAGTFVHSATLALPANVRILGEGPASVLLMTAPGDGLALNYPIQSTSIANNEIRGIWMQNSFYPSVATWTAGDVVAAGAYRKPTRGSPILLKCLVGGTTGAHEPNGQMMPNTSAAQYTAWPLTITLSGSPTSDVPVDIRIVTNGGYGVGQFEYSTDGANTWSAATNIEASVALTDGITAHFQSGTYSTVVSPTSSVDYASPAFRWSLFVGTTIVDGSAQWEVIQAGSAIDCVCAAYVSVHDVQVGTLEGSNYYNIGVALDGAEIFLGEKLIFTTETCVWIVGDASNTTTASLPQLAQLSNGLAFENVDFNGGTGNGNWSLVDDGGLWHSFDDCNFQGLAPVFLGGANGSRFHGFDFEGASTALFTARGTSCFSRISGAVVFGVDIRQGNMSAESNPLLNAIAQISESTTVSNISFENVNLGIDASSAIVGGGGVVALYWRNNTALSIPLADALIYQLLFEQLNGDVLESGIAVGFMPAQFVKASVDIGGGLALHEYPWGDYFSASSGILANVANTYGDTNMLIVPANITGNFGFASIQTPGDGFLLEITSFANYTMTFKNNDTTGIEAGYSPILTPTAADVTVGAPAAGGFVYAKLQYSNSQAAWLLKEHT